MTKYLKTALKGTILILVTFLSFEKTDAQQIALTKEAGVIPPDFNKNNDTLLIFSGNPFYNKAIKKQLLKNYTGAFVFVKKVDKYSPETCRYVLYEGIEVTRKITTDGPFKGQRDVVTHDNFRIEDRKTSKNYINPNSYYADMMTEYLTALDQARKN